MHITFIITGGTIFQTKDAKTGCMVIGARLDDIVSPEFLVSMGVYTSRCIDLNVRSGADLTYEIIFAARDAIRDNLSRSAVFILVTGTDTLEEFAFCLDLLLGNALVAASASLVVTGAMKPYDIEGYDGSSNVQQAVQANASKFGVLVVLNDSIHLARYVRKVDSQLMGAFQSHPGPVREGRVRLYYGPPLDAAAWRDPRFASLDAAAVAAIGRRVAIWVTGVSAGLLPEALVSSLAGLVVAAPGTGSLAAALIEQLARWTSHIPVVIATRCAVGSNFDDHYYRGSRDKYERRGFLLADFAHLTATQIRNMLVLRLAAGLYPQYEHLLRTGKSAASEQGAQPSAPPRRHPPDAAAAATEATAPAAGDTGVAV
ncbi:hypothetical protein VOLCADRAFT_95209 [Volvox carteri f. nagariensis]|uniref:asparaginase n=1 Tax=Volvox carteri f. nagariensis TaxID=3068 RepID=D8U6W8_VOLCA|nr:uncharacterized protein VOLCADRAFT_95209 [Volvox carteri f. nagariensis]EFJ44511.1 hypothetical protein VOLCADRAFT_95209 [Volvox carteri f. nagariensis]|eukprot:XP_002954361.1 hypothetical protein VOLCADRAFT_95209 [Volvox carteri f. nagariensis]